MTKFSFFSLVSIGNIVIQIRIPRIQSILYIFKIFSLIYDIVTLSTHCFWVYSVNKNRKGNAESVIAVYMHYFNYSWNVLQSDTNFYSPANAFIHLTLQWIKSMPTIWSIYTNAIRVSTPATRDIKSFVHILQRELFLRKNL